jgi:ADP-ribose pyrophosphatase YjhB (NUDIX family)
MDAEVRVAVRALILHGDKLLVQRDVRELHYAFIGGRYEHGDTFEARIARELAEETSVRLASWRYLFVVENRFMAGGNRFHALEHFGLATVHDEDVQSREAHLIQKWLPLKGLRDVDLRPFQVRDAVADGTYGEIRRLVVSEWVDREDDAVRPRD